MHCLIVAIVGFYFLLKIIDKIKNEEQKAVIFKQFVYIQAFVLPANVFSSTIYDVIFASTMTLKQNQVLTRVTRAYCIYINIGSGILFSEHQKKKENHYVIQCLIT